MSDTPQQKTETAAKKGRVAIVCVMLLSLLGAAGTRYWADDRRDAAIPRQGTDAATTSLSSMNSFALGLLLGGLRGPLVMILWTQSENQKTEKDLEGVDTQIELIRLLQPEFDTVHIFQIWNKAYNISVQMASMANKYNVILGALDYAFNVDAEKPDDINIVAAIGQIYFDKLGTSSEKLYYHKRVRLETQPHANNTKLRRQDPGWRRTQLDSVLDSSGNILPGLIAPKSAQQNSPTIEGEHDDGSELQYLPQFQPYLDGVSTFGLAYNYYKRAEVLQNVQKQRHDQLSDLVIDSRPALSLKFWGEDELEQGHRRELQAFDLPVPDDIDTIDLMSAGIGLNQPIKDPQAVKMAIDGMNRAAKLFPVSLAEYVRTILHFPDRELQYLSYMEEERAELALAAGDAEYLTAMISPTDQRDGHLAKAMNAYQDCRHIAALILLRYYVDRNFVAPSLPPGFAMDHTPQHKGIEELDLMQALTVLNKAALLQQNSKVRYVDADRYEFDRFMQRAFVRARAIAMVTPGAMTTTKPN